MILLRLTDSDQRLAHLVQDFQELRKSNLLLLSIKTISTLNSSTGQEVSVSAAFDSCQCVLLIWQKAGTLGETLCDK